jgi:DNA polymerase-1
VLLDREAHATLIADLRAEEVRHADELRRVAGVAKPSSPQQVGEWLEHELRGAAPALLAGWKRTAKGALVTSREELKLHVGEMPDGIAKLVAGVLLPYRAATTRVRFFGDKLAAAAEAGGGRAFPDFKVASTAAGRMSCADPNVQQIPREARFRRLFVAPPGRRLVVADYSQIELRAAVAFAREPTMLRLLADPAADLHRHTIHLLYGVPEGEVTPEQRQRAKTFNYGLIYSMGPATLRAKLAVQLGHVIPLDEAERLWARWFDAFAGFRRWHRERLRDARDEGVLRTVLGRPRRFAPGEVAPGVVFNHPVQGSCGEGLYVALALVRRRLREAGLDAVPIIAAHDEIVLEAAEADAAEAARILEEGMREGMLAVLPDLPALGLVEAHVGDSWADKK